jgi:two-component system chemotaxis response regulator CheY
MSSLIGTHFALGPFKGQGETLGDEVDPHARCHTEGVKDMAKRVLVVDDANFMRTVVKDTLEPSGFQIAGEATNGAEAVTKYNELKPDLVTMDITMKVKDGVEAAKDILAADPNARIVMVTALGQEKMLLDCIALGVRDFVVKPFTSERIISAVQKALL